MRGKLAWSPQLAGHVAHVRLELSGLLERATPGRVG